jgi:hypothetical protein
MGKARYDHGPTKSAPDETAFHHLRGVHAGLLRCVGSAPGGIEHIEIIER